MNYDEDVLRKFLWWMCERQRIYIRRFIKDKEPPWTDDPVLQSYHFCHVHRELDKGTLYVLSNILHKDKPDAGVFLNTVLYRFFNTPEAGDALGLYLDPDEFDADDAADKLDPLARREELFSPAYRVTTHNWAGEEEKHRNILLGIIRDDVLPDLDWYVDEVFHADTAEDSFDALKEIHGVGDFLAYELLTDLNYIHLPWTENDFVNIGPGAQAGLFEIFGGSDEEHLRWLRHNQFLLFDRFDLDYPYMEWKPKLTLRDFEHAACEFQKYLGIRCKHEDRRKFEPTYYQDTFDSFP